MVVAPALIELGTLALVLLCLALALLIVAIMRKVGDLVRGVWLVGNTIADGVDAVAQGISWVLGKAIDGVDAAIGASWHLLAHLWNQLWSVIVDAAHGYADLAELVARLVYAHSGLRTLVHAIEKAFHGIEHGVKTLEKAYHGIEHRVKTLERELAHGIGNDVRVGLEKVEKTVDGIVHGTVPALRRGIDAVDNELTQLEQFVKALPGVSYLDWAAGIVAAAVGIDILNALRCPSFLKSAKGRGCGLWNGLEDLLGLLVDLVVVADVCDVLPLLDAAVSDVATPLVVALTDAGAGLCSPGSSAPAALTGPAIIPPPVYYTGDLLVA